MLGTCAPTQATNGDRSLRGAASGAATVSSPTAAAIEQVASVASAVERSPRSENTTSAPTRSATAIRNDAACASATRRYATAAAAGTAANSATSAACTSHTAPRSRDAVLVHHSAATAASNNSSGGNAGIKYSPRFVAGTLKSSTMPSAAAARNSFESCHGVCSPVHVRGRNNAPNGSHHGNTATGRVHR